MTNFISEIIWYFNKPPFLTISFSDPKLPFKRPLYYRPIQITSSMRPAQPLEVTHLIPFLTIFIILPKDLNRLLMSLRVHRTHLQYCE